MEQNTDKVVSFFRFEDLRVYHKSLEYILFLKPPLSRVASEDKELVAAPFFNTARNIANRVAEGSSRDKGQFIHFLKSAKSLVRECLIMTTLCHKMGLFSEEEESQSRQTLMELTKMMGALISSLIRSGVKETQPETDIIDDDPLSFSNEILK